ncbi:MAG: diguanylate cyclase [Mariprofundales bacterium]
MKQADHGNRLGMRIMVVLLILLSLLFALLFFTMHTWQRDAIEQQAQAQADAIAHIMVASLKTLMLSGDAESVHDWLHRMRSHQALQSLNILRRDGTVAFRDLKTINQVNQFLGATTFSRNPIPALKADNITDAELTRAIHGEQVIVRDHAANQLTMLKQIKIEQACLQCHGYEQNPIRGILLVTTSTSAAKAAMWRNDRQLLLLILLGLLGVSLLIILMHRYMESIINALGGMLFVTDKNGVIRTANHQACQTLGYHDNPPLVGKKMVSLLASDQSNINFTQVSDHEEEVLLQAADKNKIAVSVLSAKMPIGSWLEQAYLVHVLRDLTQQKESEREMRLAATVMNTVPSAIMVADHNANIQLINTAFTTITGYAADEVVGKNPNILKSGRQSKKFYGDMWDQIRQTGHWAGEIWNRRKSGVIYPEWLIINTMHDENDKVSYYVSTFLDISVQKKMEDQLRHRANHDTLTKLPNRTLLADRLNVSLSHANRSACKVGVLFIDIDGFKPVNDTHGHDAGDDLLQQIASRLLQCVRSSDTVARVGGDEFVLVLESKNQHDMLMVAEKVLQAMQKPFVLGTITCQVGASIGISTFPEGGKDPEILLKQADTAMYQAKNGGKNRAVVFDYTSSDENNR